MSEEMYEAAVAYSRLGWIVHPLKGPHAKCKSPGKAPITNDWPSRTTPLSDNELKKHFKDTDNNIGLVCGPASGVTAIDFDDLNFYADVMQGVDDSSFIISNHTKAGETATRGHILFQYDPELKQRMSKKFRKPVQLLGIDILGVTDSGGGSNLVLPPSIHQSGEVYRFTRQPDTIADIPVMPPEFKERLLHLTKLEDELSTCAKRCRKWVTDLLGNPSILHGGDGRRCMLAMTAELRLAGLSDDGVHFLAKIIYRTDYDRDETDEELIHVKAMAWLPETLMMNFPEYCTEDNTGGKCRAATPQTSAPSGDVDKWKDLAAEVVGDEVQDGHPVSLAKDIQAIRPVFYDAAQVYWAWNPLELRYEIRDSVDMLVFLRNMIGGADQGIYDQKFTQQYLKALQVTGRERDLQPPGTNIIQFKNGCIDLDTGEMFLPTPDKLYVKRVPHNLGDSEDTPVIDKLFTDWVGEKFAMTLLEYCAYCLYDGYPLHVIFVLLGAGRNGKGQFMQLLGQLVGKENTTATDLEILASASNGRFESAKMYQKKVVLMGETNFNELRNTAILKQLSGGDIVRGEFKNKPNFEFENTAKITIASNSLPTTSDKTEGFYRRWLILDFPNKFPEGKPIVDTIPEHEYENLCRKCIRVLKELLERGSFSNQGTIDDRMARYEAKSNPLTAFIRDWCVKDVNVDVPLWVIRDEYERYCRGAGIRVVTTRELSRSLDDLGFEVQSQKKYSVTQVRKYKPEYTKECNWVTVIGLTPVKYASLRLESTDGKNIDTSWRV